MTERGREDDELERESSCSCMSVSSGNTILCIVSHILLLFLPVFPPSDTLETPVPPQLTFVSSSLSLSVSVNSFCLPSPFKTRMKEIYRTLM